MNLEFKFVSYYSTIVSNMECDIEEANSMRTHTCDAMLGSDELAYFLIQVNQSLNWSWTILDDDE